MTYLVADPSDHLLLFIRTSRDRMSVWSSFKFTIIDFPNRSDIHYTPAAYKNIPCTGSSGFSSVITHKPVYVSASYNQHLFRPLEKSEWSE